MRDKGDRSVNERQPAGDTRQIRARENTEDRFWHKPREQSAAEPDHERVPREHEGKGRGRDPKQPQQLTGKAPGKPRPEKPCARQGRAAGGQLSASTQQRASDEPLGRRPCHKAA